MILELQHLVCIMRQMMSGTPEKTMIVLLCVCVMLDFLIVFLLGSLLTTFRDSKDKDLK